MVNRLVLEPQGQENVSFHREMSLPTAQRRNWATTSDSTCMSQKKQLVDFFAAIKSFLPVNAISFRFGSPEKNGSDFRSSFVCTKMSYAYLFKYIIIGDTGETFDSDWYFIWQVIDPIMS
jgi:hypothetical protein